MSILKGVLTLFLAVLMGFNSAIAQEKTSVYNAYTISEDDVHISKVLLDDRSTVKTTQLALQNVENLVFNFKSLIKDNTKRVSFNDKLNFEPLKFGLYKNKKFKTKSNLKGGKEDLFEQLFNGN